MADAGLERVRDRLHSDWCWTEEDMPDIRALLAVVEAAMAGGLGA